MIIRQRLADQRCAGRPFSTAWPVALRSLPPRGTTQAARADRAALRAALRATRWSWQHAYDGEPATRVEVAAELLLIEM